MTDPTIKEARANLAARLPSTTEGDVNIVVYSADLRTILTAYDQALSRVGELTEALDTLNRTIGGYMLNKGWKRDVCHARLKGEVADMVHAALQPPVEGEGKP